jgi:hypothetical protein
MVASGINDPLTLELIIILMFITTIIEFGFIIFFKLGGYPIALWRIFRVPFFFRGTVEADGEITITPHKRSIIENNPNIADMVPHFTIKNSNGKPEMKLIDQKNAGRRIGRDFYIYRLNQSTNIPIRTGYKDGLISAEALNKAFHADIVERLRNIGIQREKKTKIPWIKVLFGILLAIAGIYVIYFGLRLLF